MVEKARGSGYAEDEVLPCKMLTDSRRTAPELPKGGDTETSSKCTGWGELVRPFPNTHLAKVLQFTPLFQPRLATKLAP